MMNFDEEKSRFPTFAKLWAFQNSPEMRRLSQRLFVIVMPIFVIGAAYVLLSGLIYQNSHP